MDSVLNGKIAALGLMPIDKKAYIKYLKPYEKVYKKAGIDVNRFKYYKLYGEKHMLYSVEYLMQTPIKDLLERDRGNQMHWVKTDE
ncbi:hydrolase [Bacillus thuringiensis serovar nigeriensis]|uniref:hydrolase n=2 Tax=Bacillus TaxID=1386 RepID=UPI000A3A58E5|nr:hydrolase [Bacillus thuringiensis]MDA2246261.1 hydrolase [Bacillus cereus]MEC3434055.1 hydrolase [Bacillus cereus]MED2981933.1 hydrolase [Bacillus thuringiensis]MRB57535.1 hydrolase [Bacillus thuringiensis]MRC96651.1 hydrolase [Bacillus thuringiensis]